MARAAATKSDSMTSSMPTRRLRISTGVIAMAAVSAGSTSERRCSAGVVPQPPTLNQCRSTANTMIRMMPKKKDGMPSPTRENTRTA